MWMQSCPWRVRHTSSTGGRAWLRAPQWGNLRTIHCWWACRHQISAWRWFISHFPKLTVTKLHFTQCHAQWCGFLWVYIGSYRKLCLRCKVIEIKKMLLLVFFWGNHWRTLPWECGIPRRWLQFQQRPWPSCSVSASLMSHFCYSWGPLRSSGGLWWPCRSLCRVQWGLRKGQCPRGTIP